MVGTTSARLRHGLAVVGDGLRLPIGDDRVDRVFTRHFYGHLCEPEREAFMTEYRRLGAQLVVVDSALRPGNAPEQWQDRVLNEGSRHRVY